jgi:mannose-1-phosphate guanylyltransferase
MKALLLAGGKGTRLRPITNNLPKPMVHIMGKPLLERTILNLKNCGVDEVVLSTCYKSKHIKDFLKDGAELGVKINYITEDIPLGTGGAIKNAEEFFDDTFIILNSDIVSDIDYAELIRYHKEKKAHVTIAMTEVEDPSQYGVIEFNDSGFVTAFKEKPKIGETSSKFINAGVYIFEPEVLKEIPANSVVSIEKETYPSLLKKGYNLAAYKFHGYWIDIGTLNKYKKVHEDILTGKCRILCKNKGEILLDKKGIIIEKGVKIHPTARIFEPAYIGNNVFIDAYAKIGPYAVIGNESYIGYKSMIKSSVIWDNVRINEFVKLCNAVITSKCIVKRDTEVLDTVLIS